MFSNKHDIMCKITMYCEQITSGESNINDEDECGFENEMENNVVLYSIFINISNNMYYNLLIMDALGILPDIGKFGFSYHNSCSTLCAASIHPTKVELKSNSILQLERITKILANNKKENLYNIKLPGEEELNKRLFNNKYIIYSFIIKTRHILKDVIRYIVKIYCDCLRKNSLESIQDLLDFTPKSLLMN